MKIIRLKNLLQVLGPVLLLHGLALAQEDLPIDSVDDLVVSFNRFIGWFIGFFWAFAVACGTWAAVTFLLAAGQPEKLKQSKKIVLYTLIAATVGLLATGIKTIVTNILLAN